MPHVQLRLVGPITAYGGQTYVTSQTGTGSTFVMSAGPTITGTLTLATATASGNVTVGTGNTVADIIVKSSVANGGAGFSELLLGNASTDTRGYVSYSHAADTMTLGAAGANRAVLSGTGYSVTGTLAASGDFAINASKFTVTASSGNTSVAGTLGVTGAATLSSTLSVTGTAVVGTGQAIADVIARSSVANGGAGFSELLLGNTSTDTRGYVSYSHAAEAMAFGAQSATRMTLTAAGLSVTGTLAASSDFAINTSKFTVTASSGNTAIAGTLDVTGAVTGSSFADSKGDVRTIPQNSKSAAYTTVLSDAGKHILHPSADTTARTFTIDSNANVAYPIGTAITFVNQNAAGTLTIAITTDTMRLAGAGTTGSRTLAANGIATALKLTSTEWIISGTNLT